MIYAIDGLTELFNKVILMEICRERLSHISQKLPGWNRQPHDGKKQHVFEWSNRSQQVKKKHILVFLNVRNIFSSFKVSFHFSGKPTHPDLP